MSLAALDMHVQVQHLYTLVLTIFQPVFLLALVLGFLVASAHFLTMLGTRWGDRRASPKALVFSGVVHALLAGGIVSMIPEYRQRVFASLSDLQELKIEVQTPELEPGEVEVAHAFNGQVPVWERLPDMVREDIHRTDAPLQSASPDTAVRPDVEPTPFTPAPTFDSARLPQEAQPIPQQMAVAASPAELQPLLADPTTQPEIFQDARSEPTPSASMQRSRITSTPTDDAQQVEPRPGMVDRVVPDINVSDQARALPLDSNPIATLTPAPVGEIRVRRTGPAPTQPVDDLGGRDQTGLPNPSMSGAPVSPNLVRTKPRNPSSLSPSESELSGTRTVPRTSVPQPVLPSADLALNSFDRMPLPPLEAPRLSKQTGDTLMRSQQLPLAYQLRGEERRQRAVMEFGGSAESEDAVDRSLKWLASVQHPDGYWDASEFEAGKLDIGPDGQNHKFAGKDADTGITALALLAFLGKQNTLTDGQYSENVQRGLRWLVSQQRTLSWQQLWKTTNPKVELKWAEKDLTDEGYLGGNASAYCAMYCHAMATFALGEAYAVSRNHPEAQWLRDPLEKAINFILASQLRDGGWRYLKSEDGSGDVSVLGWQVMALKSAEMAGFQLPPVVTSRIAEFLKQNASGSRGGLGSYRKGEPHSAPMTAEALFCRQVLGIAAAQSKEVNEEAVNYLLLHRPARTELNYYYWYYGTLAMYQHGGEPWNLWNTAARDLIISEQEKSGPSAGSWPPRDIWGGFGGRIYSTALATLTLEVYYRYQSAYNLANPPGTTKP